MHWLAPGLRKVKFRWNRGVIMTAPDFKRHFQPISSAWRHLAFLPVTLSQSAQLNDLLKVVPIVDKGTKFEPRVSCFRFYSLPIVPCHPSWFHRLSSPMMSHFQGYCMRLLYKEHSMCAQSLNLVWLFAIPWTVVLQTPLSTEVSSQVCWSGMPFPPPGDVLDSGVKTTAPASLALAGGFFTMEPLKKPIKNTREILNRF